MKKIKLLLGGITAIALLLVGAAGVANAHSFRAGDNIVVSGKAIEETLFASGRSVNISSEVFGDVFCAGQSITVTGTVHGDVICAGQNVNVAGKVDGDIRLAGQSITVSGDIKGNATLAGQSVSLDSGSRFGGDVTIGSSDSIMNGTVGRDLSIGGESALVAGKVGRNLSGTINNLQLSSSANVAGDVDFMSNKDVVREDGSIVGGTIKRSDLPREAKPQAKFNLWWVVFSFVAMLVTALVLALLFPQLLQSVTNQAMPTPWIALLTGFLASLAVPAVIVLLAITVVGLPLAIILGLSWLLVLLLSGPVFGYYVGRLILRDSRQPLVIMLAGAGLLFLAYFVPIIGALALLAAMWFGSGMLLGKLFKVVPRPVYTLAEAPQASSVTKRKSKR